MGVSNILTRRVLEAISGDQWESDETPPKDDVVECGLGVSIGAAAEEATGPQAGAHLDGCKEPCGLALATDERVNLIGLKLNELEAPQHAPIEALCRR